MANTPSVYMLAKQIEASIMQAVSDQRALGAESAAAQATQLKRAMAEVRLDIRDYEFASTRAEQLVLAAVANQRIAGVREGMLVLSQDGIFSAIDIAHMSAIIDQITEQLS
jgi:hypothetical protein